MPSMSSTYQCVYGSGHLILDGGSSPLVGYNIILDLDDFSGGGNSSKLCVLISAIDISRSWLAATMVTLFRSWSLALGLTNGPNTVH